MRQLRRFTFNHHLGRIKANLDTRAAQKEAGRDLTPSLSWSGISCINEFNAWKNGLLEDSPENDDGSRGLAWRTEVPADVFECASSDAGQALANFSDSKKGTRQGAPVGFPHFVAKGHTTPSFRLRNKSGLSITSQPIRFSDARHLRLGKIGAVRVFGPSRQVRRMLELGRFHIYSATVTYKGGRWLVSLTGVATPFNRARRDSRNRHQAPVGVDRGITSLAVVADVDGQHLISFEGVKELRRAETRLIKAQKTLARATPGSKGRAQARARLNKRHAVVARTRKHLVHQVSSWLVSHCSRLVLEDLNVAGMAQNRHLAKSVSDAAMGELRRQITYKAQWYGTEVIVADRFFASTKTCSSCGNVKATMGLSERMYRCDCGLVIDRDLNAAINLARWSRDVVAEAELVLATGALAVSAVT